MSTLAAVLLERLRHHLRVAGVAFFVVCFVGFTTAQREDWFAVAVGAALGLLFGLLFVFGDMLADAEDR